MSGTAKRVLTLLLALGMALSVLSGCGGGGSAAVPDSRGPVPGAPAEAPEPPAKAIPSAGDAAGSAGEDEDRDTEDADRSPEDTGRSTEDEAPETGDAGEEPREKIVSTAKEENGGMTFTFSALPRNLEEMEALPEAELDNPFQAAALTVCALCVYGTDAEGGIEMLNYLKGPAPLSAYDRSFLKARFEDGKSYIPFSYFAGAAPGNDYTPDESYSITVFTTVASDLEQGYKKLFITSGGADSPRPVTLRLAKTGKWYLWDQALMPGIRPPEGSDPWA